MALPWQQLHFLMALLKLPNGPFHPTTILITSFMFRKEWQEHISTTRMWASKLSPSQDL